MAEGGQTRAATGTGQAGWPRTVDARLQCQEDLWGKGRGWDEPGPTPVTAKLFNSGPVAATCDHGILHVAKRSDGPRRAN